MMGYFTAANVPGEADETNRVNMVNMAELEDLPIQVILIQTHVLYLDVLWTPCVAHVSIPGV